MTIVVGLIWVKNSACGKCHLRAVHAGTHGLPPTLCGKKQRTPGLDAITLETGRERNPPEVNGAAKNQPFGTPPKTTSYGHHLTGCSHVWCFSRLTQSTQSIWLGHKQDVKNRIKRAGSYGLEFADNY